jgi:membrane associated rhomboid family serine protease
MKMWIAMIVLLGVLWFASISAGLPFGNTAHLGGLSAGLGYGYYLSLKYKRKTSMIRRYFA